MSRWPLLVALAAFGMFAGCFLYFFVDDEAIPLVYAQNLLHGKGLVYSAFEGRVEGYSDLLHIGLATLLLALTKAFGLPKLAVFFIGKALSLFSAGFLIWLIDRTMIRWPGVRTEGRVSGLMFLALAGPLAVWSCSSLEAVAFSAILSVLLYALWADDSPRANQTACLVCVLAFLERIDGFLHAGVVVTAALFVAPRAKRNALLRQVVLPAGAVFVLYHLWRRWYFGEWLPMPVIAKVLYKLTAHGVFIDKPADESYLVGFLKAVGWTPLAVLPVPFVSWKRHRESIGLFVATISLAAYVTFVGDWMFGFRFFVPLLPAIALLVASSISALATRSRVSARLAVALVAICALGSAWRFERTYEQTQNETAWWLHASTDPLRYFTPFYSLYAMLVPYVASSDTIAFNQAGFVPFMLDVDNIDDLGICSRFVATLPSTDVIFTGVGRYSPLTNRNSIRASHAYVLYREPKWLIARGDLTRHANGNHSPRFLLGNRYEAFQYDAEGDNQIYRRTDVSVESFQTDPRSFTENLAHVSYLRRAWVQGRPVPAGVYLREFPYLLDQIGEIAFEGSYAIDLVFDEKDVDAHELHIDQIDVNAPVTASVRLHDKAGRTVFDDTLELRPGASVAYDRVFPRPIPSIGLSLRLTSVAGGSAQVRLRDVRVQGQRPALASHVDRFLRFPADRLTQAR